MFVMYSFMDKITFVAKKLVGGQELSADKAPNIAGVAKKAIRAVQKRALNATKRLAIQGGGLAAKGGRFALSKGKRGDITPDGDKKQDGDSSSAGNDAKGNDSKDDDSKGDDSKSGGDAPNGVGK